MRMNLTVIPLLIIPACYFQGGTKNYKEERYYVEYQRN